MGEKSGKSIETKSRIVELERHASTLRGLISYHQRMMLVMDHYECEEKDACKRKGQCPAIRFGNDNYLGALEESLRLIQKEISTFTDISL